MPEFELSAETIHPPIPHIHRLFDRALMQLGLTLVRLAQRSAEAHQRRSVVHDPQQSIEHRLEELRHDQAWLMLNRRLL